MPISSKIEKGDRKTIDGHLKYASFYVDGEEAAKVVEGFNDPSNVAEFYANAIRQLDAGVRVFPAACPLFVPLAEEGWTRHRATDLIAREYLFPLKLERVDTLILGCTHYPVLREAIKSAVDPGVKLIDSGEAAAAEVERLLVANNVGNTRPERPNLQFFVSDIPARFSEVGERFLGHPLGRVHRVSI